MNARALAALAVGALAGACDAASPEAPSASFSEMASQVVTSASGRLRVEVRWSPPVPVKGADAVELTFLDERGEPAAGLTSEIVPWMPAHGHGTSIRPTTTDVAPGVVVASPVYLYMSGDWQLRITLGGTLDDTAVATVHIP